MQAICFFNYVQGEGSSEVEIRIVIVEYPQSN